MASNNTINVKVTGDISDLKKAMDNANNSIETLTDTVKDTGSQTQKTWDKFGQKLNLSNLQQGAEVVADLGDKVLDIGGKSIESAAKINAMESTFKQTFGSASGEAEKLVNDMASTFGMLPNRIKPNFTMITAQFKGLGLSTEEAMQKAKVAMGLAANAAAFYDTSVEDAQSSVQSFLKGNYEAGESIGIFANETQLAAYAAKNDLIPSTEGAKEASEKLTIAVEKAGNKYKEAVSKYGEGSLEARDAMVKLKDAQAKVDEELAPQTQKWADLDEATKQAVRLDYAENMLVQAGAIDEVGSQMGQAARESGEYENQMGNLKQAQEDFYAVIGQDILPMFLDVLQDLVGLLKKAGDFWKDLPEPVRQFTIVIGALSAAVAVLLPLIVAVVTVVTTVGLPVIGIIAGIGAAIAALIVVFKNWGNITDWVGEKWQQMKDWFGNMWQGLSEKAGQAWDKMKETISKKAEEILEKAKEVWEGFKEWFSEFWQGIGEWFSEAWEGIKETVSEVWTSISETAKAIWEPIANFFNAIWLTVQMVWQFAWTFISNTLLGVWNIISGYAHMIFDPIIEWFKTMWEDVKTKFTEIWTAITEYLSGVWNGFKDKAIEIFTPIVEFIGNAWNTVKDKTIEIWNGLTSWLSETWNSINKKVTDTFNSIKKTFTDIWNGIKKIFTDTVTAIKNDLSKKWQDIKTTVTNVWNGIKQWLGNLWNGIKSTASNVWNGIKTVIMTPVNAAKDLITNAWNGVKTSVENVWNGLKSTASSVWEGIKSVIMNPLDGIKDGIDSMIDKFKNMFNFNITPPHIPLPQFSISGSFNPLKGQIPSLDVNWYAKGGVFNSPSIIGVGEAGTEAVLPLKDSVLGKIANMIERNMEYANNATPIQGVGNTMVQVVINGDVDSAERVRTLANKVSEQFNKQSTEIRNAYA